MALQRSNIVDKKGDLKIFLSPNARWIVTYRGPFAMDCTVDSFGNSTCVQHEPSFTIPTVEFEYGGEA